MDLSQPNVTSYPVELLACCFQVSGRLTPLGDILSFLNDPQRATLVIEDAQATPLQAGWRAGQFSGPDMVVPKAEVQLVLVGDLQADELRLLPRIEQLVVYTDTFAVNGHFHTGSETPVSDLFYVSRGPFFPASDAQVYAVQPLNVPVEGVASIMFVNKDHINLFYQMNGVPAPA
jgi:hypothetical protein